MSRLELSHLSFLRVTNPAEKGREVQIILRDLDIEISRIRFVGDTLHDMMAGKSLGAELYFVERGLNSRHTLDPMFDCSITSALPIFAD